MNEKSERTAKRFNIYDRILKLEKELLSIEGAVDVIFYLDGFCDVLNELIILVKSDIPVTIGGHWKRKKEFKNDIISIALNNGLSRTQDSIEDYGDHFYFFVMNCNKWLDKAGNTF